ncbi:hypothetical protein [Winogradskyella sp. A3E31]|uniref:hypothetical protein n=1 Tax=Winogradskyella sp. A3E31 TaxID=3349637 RepID=UPI00398B5F8B
MQPTHAFHLYQTNTPTTMKLKFSLILALSITLIATTVWELYWRNQGYYPTLNDEKALWSMERAKVEEASDEDVIILGSSRAYFDIQVEEWKEQTGKYPIQLASTGSSPLPTFHDIVHNTNFKGTVIIGVAPGLFFSTLMPEAFPWKRPQSKIDYFEDETYAQKLNFRLSIPLQNNLVLISADEEEWSDDIDLKALLNRYRIGDRTGSPEYPPFNNFGDVSIPRNMALSHRTETDKDFAQTVIDVWNFEPPKPPKSEQDSTNSKKPEENKPKWPDKEGTTAFFMEDLKTFKERNGTVVLVRCPSSGKVRQGEIKDVPRERFWDSLVKVADIPNYHFEDYEQFKNLECPEESHLSKGDADYFTRELIKLLRNDGILNQ